MSRIASILGLLLCFACSAATAQSDVKITKQPAKILRKKFDPNKPPPKEMPKLTPPEAAVCHFEFVCDTGVSSDVDQTSPGNVTITVDGADLIISMEVDVWTPNDARKKLVDHEEGHRQICEYYYKDAEAVAKKAAQAVIGKSFQGTGRDKKAATDAAMSKAIAFVSEAYMNETRVRCSAAQKIYDRLTNHSLINITEAEAIKQALAEEAKDYASKGAATQPAGKGS